MIFATGTGFFNLIYQLPLEIPKKNMKSLDVKPLNKSESGNSQTIIIMYGVGFETNAGMKVSVVR